MMYEAFFGLDGRPFTAIPETQCYYPADATETARKSLARCIQNGSGPGMLIGAPGTGKSMLLHRLAEQFRATATITILPGTYLGTRRALLQSILFDLGLPYRDLDESELRLSLFDFLDRREKRPHGLILLVDEAHALSTSVLEEVRVLSDFVRAGKPEIRVVIAGDATLEEQFASPPLAAFNQRLAARCYLDSLSKWETTEYVKAQFRHASRAAAVSIMTEDAFSSIYQATDGVPRLINQLCEHALLMAAAGGRESIDTSSIAEAWADLQQLPAPLVTSNFPPLSAAATNLTNDEVGDEQGIVEFGCLDEPSGGQATMSARASGSAGPDKPDAQSHNPVSNESDDTVVVDPTHPCFGNHVGRDNRCRPFAVGVVEKNDTGNAGARKDDSSSEDAPLRDQAMAMTSILFEEHFQEEEIVEDRIPPASDPLQECRRHGVDNGLFDPIHGNDDSCYPHQFSVSNVTDAPVRVDMARPSEFQLDKSASRADVSSFETEDEIVSERLFDDGPCTRSNDTDTDSLDVQVLDVLNDPLIKAGKEEHAGKVLSECACQYSVVPADAQETHDVISDVSDRLAFTQSSTEDVYDDLDASDPPGPFDRYPAIGSLSHVAAGADGNAGRGDPASVENTSIPLRGRPATFAEQLSEQVHPNNFGRLFANLQIKSGG